MNTRYSLFAFCAPLAFLATLSGCRSESPDAVRTHPDAADVPVQAVGPDRHPVHAPEEETDPVANLVAEVERRIAAGENEEAKTLLTEAFDAPEFDLHRSRLFYMTLATLVSLDEVGEAQARMLKMMHADINLARESIGLITTHLLSLGDTDGVLDWTASLLAFDLPDPTRNAVLNWRLQVWLRRALDEAREDPEKVEDPALRQVSPSTFAGTLLREAPEARGIEALERARELLGADTVAAGHWEPLREELGIRSQLLRRDWKQAVSRMEESRALLSDAGLQRILLAAIAEMTEAGATAEIDALCETLMSPADAHPRTARTATAQWVQNVVEAGRFDALPERLEALMARGADPLFLLSLYYRHFYGIIDQPEVLKRMLTLGERLEPMLPDEAYRQRVRMLALDGSFAARNYDRAIALLEEGISDRDAAWHKQALSKVKAHRAMDRNEPLEAVTHLRAFMQSVLESPEESAADPTTGVVHTRPMILGRNARRIGDLLTQAGDSAGARKAYDEARAFYTWALQQLEAGSPSAELARTEKDDIP